MKNSIRQLKFIQLLLPRTSLELFFDFFFFCLAFWRSSSTKDVRFVINRKKETRQLLNLIICFLIQSIWDRDSNKTMIDTACETDVWCKKIKKKKSFLFKILIGVLSHHVYMLIAFSRHACVQIALCCSVVSNEGDRWIIFSSTRVEGSFRAFLNLWSFRSMCFTHGSTSPKYKETPLSLKHMHISPTLTTLSVTANMYFHVLCFLFFSVFLRNSRELLLLLPFKGTFNVCWPLFLLSFHDLMN